MNIYSKTLNQEDYDKMDEPQHARNIHSLLSGVQNRFEHPERAWEYGIALNAIRASSTRLEGDDRGFTILDVGGGGSVFAPAAAWLDMTVTQVDPGDCGEWVARQSERIQKPLEYIQLDFMDYQADNTKYDAVVCLSTIEHVPDDEKFFLRLLEFVKDNGILVLTTDFHPTGEKQSDGHIRTYNEQTLNQLSELAKEKGFVYYGDVDYSYFEPNVYNYTFASLVMIKPVAMKTQVKARKTRKTKV